MLCPIHDRIFNACFDWTDGSWHTSPEVYTVPAGDTITSSVTYIGDRTYQMYIASAQTGKSVTTNYKLQAAQTEVESVAYFVLEHQPDWCAAYPSDGVCIFENVQVAVEGKTVESPTWTAHQEQPKCNSKATVVDPHTLKFTWDAGSDAQVAPKKWGYGQ